jgi:hypothetical protein
MSNNTKPVAFDGRLMENRGWKRKIVALDPTAKSNPDALIFLSVICQKP